jgi:hypothetical protein
MDPRWITIILMLSLLAGCLNVDVVPDPKDGDLKLNISLSKKQISAGEGNISMTIELKNVCDRDLMVEEQFAFGSSLFPRVYASNGSMVELRYRLLDYEPKYSLFHPGETKFVTEDLVPASIEIDGIERDFNWDIFDTYSLSVIWRGIDHSTFNVTSNTEYLTVGDYLDPVEGDLSFTISMDKYAYPPDPERMDLTMVLENVCDHPVLVQDEFFLGYTLFPNARSSDGWEIGFIDYLVDYQPTHSPLHPLRMKTCLVDISGTHTMYRGDETKDFSWDIADTYSLTVTWWGVKSSNFNITSNEISITIQDG